MSASLHENFGPHSQPKGPSNRSFGLVFTAVFFLLALAPLRHGAPVRLWAAAPGAIFLALSLLHPVLLAPLNRAWMRLGLLIARVTNPVLTGFIFVFVLLPTALVFRFQRKDRLGLKWDPQATSYWIPRTPPGPRPTSMANQF
jgi:hypothetical protein